MSKVSATTGCVQSPLVMRTEGRVAVGDGADVGAGVSVSARVGDGIGVDAGGTGVLEAQAARNKTIGNRM